jgi:hypothetical protein
MTNRWVGMLVLATERCLPVMRGEYLAKAPVRDACQGASAIHDRIFLAGALHAVRDSRGAVGSGSWSGSRYISERPRDFTLVCFPSAMQAGNMAESESWSPTLRWS